MAGRWSPARGRLRGECWVAPLDVGSALAQCKPGLSTAVETSLGRDATPALAREDKNPSRRAWPWVFSDAARGAGAPVRGNHVDLALTGDSRVRASSADRAWCAGDVGARAGGLSDLDLDVVLERVLESAREFTAEEERLLEAFAASAATAESVEAEAADNGSRRSRSGRTGPVSCTTRRVKTSLRCGSSWPHGFAVPASRQ